MPVISAVGRRRQGQEFKVIRSYIPSSNSAWTTLSKGKGGRRETDSVSFPHIPLRRSAGRWVPIAQKEDEENCNKNGGNTQVDLESRYSQVK